MDLSYSKLDTLSKDKLLPFKAEMESIEDKTLFDEWSLYKATANSKLILKELLTSPSMKKLLN